MGNQGLFPGVAVPLAFFCTLFFRHRKKSVNAPWDCKSHHPRRSRRVRPHREKKVCACGRTKGLSVRTLEAFRPRRLRNLSPWGDISTAPRPSRRVMLPDRKLLPAELSCNAACRGLSAHPMHPFGSPSEDNAHGTTNPTPRRSRHVMPPAGDCFRQNRRTSV